MSTQPDFQPYQPKNQIEALFFDARAILEITQQQAFLDQACAGDPALRREVQQLLDALDSPLAERISRPAFSLQSKTSGTEVTGEDQSRGNGEHHQSTGESDRGDPNLLATDQRQVGRYKLLEQIGEGGMGYHLTR